MRSVALLALMIQLAGRSSEVETATFYRNSQPANLAVHENALALLARYGAAKEDIPRPLNSSEMLVKGVGVAIVRGWKRSSRPFLADSSAGSTLLIYLPDAGDLKGSTNFQLAGRTFLYIVVRQAGGICAGYAKNGSITINPSPEGYWDVTAGVNLETYQLNGEKGCRGGPFSFSVKAFASAS